MSSNEQNRMHEGSVGPIRWGLTGWDLKRGGLLVRNDRQPNTFMRGRPHPQHKHGQETLEAKAERSQRCVELRDLEALSFAIGLNHRPKMAGSEAARLLKQIE